MIRPSLGHLGRVPLKATLLALVALGALAAFALGAQPVAGGHYKGHIDNSPVNTAISFRVSGNGAKVRNLKTKLDPVFGGSECGGTTPSVTQTSKPADISRRNSFRGVIHYTYPGSGGTHGKAIVHGKFRRNGRERGTVKASFHNSACDGTATYSTKVH